MDVLLRSDWWLRVQLGMTCAAMALIGAVLFGVF